MANAVQLADNSGASISTSNPLPVAPKPFLPVPTSTTSVSANTTSSAATLLNTPGTDFQVRCYNAGSVVGFVKFGGSGVTSTTAELPLAPGSVEVFSANSTVTHIAGITSANTTTIYATVGIGL